MGNKLFQHSTLGALMAGMFEGSLPISELLQHGTIGIGTLHGLDGELIILEGEAYQVKGDGSIHLVDGSKKTPYAAVTHFETEQSLEAAAEDGEAFEQILSNQFSSTNTFQAVKVTGTFQHMLARSVSKQEPPYPRLVEVARSQSEFTREEVEGTLVGFYAPDIFGSVAVPGFHWHFLSDDKLFGGHVLDFSIKEATAEWQTIETLNQHFPVENQKFMQEAIDYGNLSDDIEEAE